MPRLISGYILDVGDVLRIQLVGKLNDRLQTPILPDGSVVIKKVGQVSVSGLPIEEAIEKIKAYVGERILGTEVNVSLEIIRNMNVLLIGNTSNPGMYTLPGNTDILSSFMLLAALIKMALLETLLTKEITKFFKKLIYIKL